METAEPNPYLASEHKLGKIEVNVELNGKKYTFKSDVITDFELSVDYDNHTFSDGFMEHSIPDPPVKSVTLSWRPLKNDQNVELTQQVENIEPKPRVYKDGTVTFPRQQLGGSMSRFEDRKKMAMLALMELGIDNVVARKPAILQATNQFRCTPKLSTRDYFTAKEGDTVEIKDGKVMITSHNGAEKTGWLDLP